MGREPVILTGHGGCNTDPFLNSLLTASGSKRCLVQVVFIGVASGSFLGIFVLFCFGYNFGAGTEYLRLESMHPVNSERLQA